MFHNYQSTVETRQDAGDSRNRVELRHDIRTHYNSNNNMSRSIKLRAQATLCILSEIFIIRL